MAWRYQPQVIRRRRDGTFDLVLGDDGREAVRVVLAQFDEVLEETAADDPSLRRLHPPAYGDDDERNAAYQLLAGDELRSSRRAGVEAVLSTLGGSVLSEGDAWLWLRTFNAVRLVAAARLGLDLGDEGDAAAKEDAVDPEDPDAGLWNLYALTRLVENELVTALSG